MKRYTIDKKKCECCLEEFYENAAKSMGVKITGSTMFDCRKICVSKRVQEAIWNYYWEVEEKDDDQIFALLFMFGPKATIEEDAYVFEVEEGFLADGN